jgi:hypothetical protein
VTFDNTLVNGKEGWGGGGGGWWGEGGKFCWGIKMK